MGSVKYFLGGDMSVLLFKNQKSVSKKKMKRFIYIYNGIWTIVLVKHLTICLINIIFFSHFAYCFGMIHLCLNYLLIETWQKYNCACLYE